MAAVLTIVLVAVVGVGIVSQIETSVFGISIFTWAIVGIYFYGLRLIYLEGKFTATVDKPNSAPKANGITKYKALFKAFSGYTLAAIAILLAAPHLVQAADQLATKSGMGHTFIGTTLVALATSLPELVATLVAFRMGVPDLALGNIFGSNAFNILLFAPLDILYSKNLFTSVKMVHAVTAFGVVVATGIAVMGQLYRKKERTRFAEPSSETVVVVIVLFLFLLYRIK